jgi:hypothetical protein
LWGLWPGWLNAFRYELRGTSPEKIIPISDYSANTGETNKGPTNRAGALAPKRCFGIQTPSLGISTGDGIRASKQLCSTCMTSGFPQSQVLTCPSTGCTGAGRWGSAPRL